MLLFPNCKINLGLHILNKREDGYHNLETVFYPVGLKDALEVIPSENTSAAIEFSASGLTAGDADNNLCIKAYQILKKDFPQLPSVKIHLHKAIPVGAGLGGGSADAAFMLKLLNDKFGLDISPDQLTKYSLQLGSDCPFFIINKPCYATGRGEILEDMPIDLSAYKIVLVNPGIHINTGWAFSQLTPGPSKISIKEIVQQPINSWKAELNNDFEEAVFAAHPEIMKIKEGLYLQGALYAAMSGSGSTVFGIFSSKPDISNRYPSHYFIKTV